MSQSIITWHHYSALSTELSANTWFIWYCVVSMAVFVWMLQLVFNQGLGKAIGSAFVFMLFMLLFTTGLMFLLLIILFQFPTSASDEPVVDVMKIAGKSKSYVSEVLGNELSCGKSKYGEKCQYQKGETEIVYINGKADWITIEGIDHIPFSPKALNAIGLENNKPSFANSFALQWSPHQGLMEVTIFKGNGTSDYAFIKVKTK